VVLEFGGTRTLAGQCREFGGRIPWQEAMPWMKGLCDVLTYLHSQVPPVVHRDLKPENVLLDDNGQIMLIDFGIAKATPAAATTRVIARAVTHGFSSPEQVIGTGTDARSDIYSFGATFYHLLTGKIPPPAHERLAGRELQPPSELLEEFPLELERLLLRCLSLNVDLRPAHTQEVRLLLDAIEQQPLPDSHQTLRTTRIDPEGDLIVKSQLWPTGQGVRIDKGESLPDGSESAATGWSQKRRTLCLVVVGAGVLIAAGLLWYQWNHRNDGRSSAPTGGAATLDSLTTISPPTSMETPTTLGPITTQGPPTTLGPPPAPSTIIPSPRKPGAGPRRLPGSAHQAPTDAYPGYRVRP